MPVLIVPVPASQDAVIEGEEGSPLEGATDAAVAGQQGDRPPVGPGALVPAMRTVVSDLAHALCTQVKATSCSCSVPALPMLIAALNQPSADCCGALHHPYDVTASVSYALLCSRARYVVAHMGSFLNSGVTRTHV